MVVSAGMAHMQVFSTSAQINFDGNKVATHYKIINLVTINWTLKSEHEQLPADGINSKSSHIVKEHIIITKIIDSLKPSTRLSEIWGNKKGKRY